LTCLIE